jgi:site-specific DNA recombinase
VKLDGYIRVSDVNDRKGPSYISPTVQRQAIERAASQLGLTLGEVVVEEDVSGARKTKERGLEELIARCERGESEGIIVAKLDRLSRGSLLEQAEIWERIGKARTRLIAADDGFDSADPGSEFQFNIRAAVAREEWRKIQANWNVTRSRAISRGAFTARTPFGYGRDDDGVLVPNGNADVVRELFARRAQGATIGALAEWLADIPPSISKLSGCWSYSTVSKILKNEVYLGIARHGDFVNENAHEPLVARAQFDAVQRARPVFTPKTKNNSSRALVAGLASCANCGHTLNVNIGYGGRLRYYCLGRSIGGCSARPLIHAETLDRIVEEQFLALLADRALVADAAPGSNGNLAKAQEELEAADAELMAFVTGQSALDSKLFTAGVEARQQRVDEARRAVADASSHTVSLRHLPTVELLDLWNEASIAERRPLVAALFDSISVSKGGNVAFTPSA